MSLALRSDEATRNLGSESAGVQRGGQEEDGKVLLERSWPVSATRHGRHVHARNSARRWIHETNTYRPHMICPLAMVGYAWWWLWWLFLWWSMGLWLTEMADFVLDHGLGG